MDYTSIENFSNSELIEELEVRGCRMFDLGYDVVDIKLYDEIFAVFDSLSVFEHRELRDLVLSFYSAKK